MFKNLIALDYGDKTIGVAVSKESVALGVETIRRDRENVLRASLRRLAELIEQYDVSAIVLGFPKNMNNTEGERCAKTLVFKKTLEERFKNIPVILWDERLSTAGARRALSGNIEEKAVIDEMAAVFILQGYIDKKRKEEINESG